MRALTWRAVQAPTGGGRWRAWRRASVPRSPAREWKGGGGRGVPRREWRAPHLEALELAQEPLHRRGARLALAQEPHARRQLRAGVKARGLRSDRQALSLPGVPRREWRAGRGGRVGQSPAAGMGAAAHLRRLGRLGAVHADADAGASIRGAGLPASVSTALGPSLHSRAGLTGVARGEEQRELAVPRRRPDRLRSGPASPAAQMEAAAGHGTARAGVKARGLRSARQSRSPAPRMGGNGGRGHESRARNGGRSPAPRMEGEGGRSPAPGMEAPSSPSPAPAGAARPARRTWRPGDKARGLRSSRQSWSPFAARDSSASVPFPAGLGGPRPLLSRRGTP